MCSHRRSKAVAIEGVEPHYEIEVYRRGHLDELDIRVEVSKDVFSDEVKGLEALRDKIQHEIASVLGINAGVKLVEPRSITRSKRNG